MEDEMTYIHQQEQKLKIDIKRLSIQVKSSLHIMIYSVLLHKVNLAVESKSKVLRIRDNKKPLTFKKQQKETTNSSDFIQKEAIHNFLSYNLCKKEHMLSYSLDHHIPRNVTRNEIKSNAFELFYQNIVRNVSNLPEHKIDRIQTKLR